MNYNEWFENQKKYIQENGGYGAVQLRLNIRSGKEDITEKIVIVTDKAGSSICVSSV